jgi:2-dehydro-3-deoxyphosphogluconate aldolase / (4S)-4-hydroxy-2-oxoglutarate aldolase
MDSQDWLMLLKRCRLLAVIRAPSLSSGLAMAQAAAAGGIQLIEITWDSAEAAAIAVAGLLDRRRHAALPG